MAKERSTLKPQYLPKVVADAIDRAHQDLLTREASLREAARSAADKLTKLCK